MTNSQEMMKRIRRLAFDRDVCGPNEYYAEAVRWAVQRIDYLETRLDGAVSAIRHATEEYYPCAEECGEAGQICATCVLNTFLSTVVDDVSAPTKEQGGPE